ncbi:glycosyl hydrolase 115 family protein [Vulcaniibacterium tengchongense]|uniref:Glycosyl hydrolase family 115 (Putative glucuronidase) n=1 Tax=Vulcaniibacterium tengchongense TaxID=1273429 RepID=A0A3N4VPU0_9GAMM|nr:glycosyl hydrolase 115 family protein [Vulcaniibacterium tengchongense]RPE81221.1 glycosyl hydrolase family 115 (putative glucuronidase) [Vulcaniibacterium tengchongense]
MRIAPLLALLLLTTAAPLHAGTGCAAPAAVCERAVARALPLIDARGPVSILVAEGDHPGVLRAARELRDDLSKVAGRDAALVHEPGAAGRTAIIAGTLGHSALVDRIVRERGLETGDVAGRWEAHLLQVIERPLPGIDRALLIAGGDKRGTVFGLYELSRRIGVSPWHWWADVPVARRDALHVAPGRFVDAPRVRYRGIFLNDEDPALGGWMKAKFGGPNHRFYEHVFELILRLKGNYLWPAMWGRAFHDDDPLNPKLADEYGVVIGTTHHEPMMRAHVEWERYGKGPWDYAKNAAALQRFWREGIERMNGYESVVTLGMRGDGDEPMAEDTAIGLLERIVADQRRIVADVTGRPAERTPQVWALYKEVQDYFDAGMRVPDDVTLLFADDNWGNIRRLPRLGDRPRTGGYGVYYHFDYVGGPRNYKWLNTTQIERVWEQMGLAWAYGADRLWIVNVGDLKPMEFPIAFFLDQAWNPEAMTLERLRDYPARWAAEQFGPAQAAEIGELLTRYTQYNARRKPELLSADTWSLANFDEAERVVAGWEALAGRALEVKARLPRAWHDAYFQLVEYPILASGNLNRLYVALARNRAYAAQRRASTNSWADEVQRLFARDAELQRLYEQGIAGGKWPHMMSQPRIGYTHWQQPERNVLPPLARVDVPDRGVLGVAVEGDERGWPVLLERARLPTMDPVAATSRRIVLFNRGRAPVSYTAHASQPWLKLSSTAGEVRDEQTLRVDVDWRRLPPGRHRASVFLLGGDRTEVRVDVPVHVPADLERASGFVESEGHIAIEAGHYARALAPPGLAWRTIPHLGRTLSAVVALPATAPPQEPGGDGARLEYPLWLHAPGEVEVRVTLSPSLDFRGGEGLRYAVSIDDEAPQMVAMKLDPTPGHADFRAWERAVSDSVHVAVSRHRVRAGARTLKLWRVDPGVAFQRIEVVREPLRPSYLGPPESLRR